MSRGGAGPTLYSFAGLPGAGKTTLARALAAQRGASFLRIDAIELALRDVVGGDLGPLGYEVGCAMARENLRLGRDVVADSVNPLRATREMWRDAARQCDATCVEIEVICSDREQHRERVEARESDLSGFVLPSWSQVRSRTYEPWDLAPLVVDTAHATPDASIRQLIEVIDPRKEQANSEGPIRGGCLCGAVRYEVDGPFLRAGHCHCSRCRKHTGTAVATQGRVRREDFRLLSGGDQIEAYRPGDGSVKAFCTRCGSSLFGGTWPDGPEVSIRLGSVDGDPGIRPQEHTFVGSRAPWDEICDTLPRHEGKRPAKGPDR